jgi:aminomethyltransferase
MSQHTPLYNSHKALGAKFVDFAGWEMPVYYTMIKDEHLATRHHVGLFDVSHMGQLLVDGPEALAFLQKHTTNDVSKLKIGRAQYSFVANENGGVVDDIIVYRRGDSEYLLVVNASNTYKMFHWLSGNQTKNVSVNDVSANYALIAVQGPRAREVLRRTGIYPNCPGEDAFKPFSFIDLKFAAKNITVACTGYTGEDGVEIFCPPEIAELVWTRLLEEDPGVKAAGLGSRDTLRIEAGFPLYGHELSETLVPVGLGYDWVIKLNKGPFNGKAVMEKALEKGPKFKLVGVEVIDLAVLRSDMKIFLADNGELVGWVSSGTKLPTIQNSVGLAFLKSEIGDAETPLLTEVRGKSIRLKRIPLPFYKRSSKQFNEGKLI